MAETNEPKTSGEQKPGKTIEFTKTAVNATEKAVVTSFDKTKNFVQHVDPRKGVRFIETLLNWDRKIFPPDVFEKVVDWFGKAGFFGLLAAQILAAVLFVITAIKMQGQFWSTVFYGLGVIILLAILQFTADRFLSADRAMIEHSPSRMGSAAFLECLAVLAEIAGIGAFIFYIVQAKQMSQWSLLWNGIGAWVLLDALAHIALNPSMVNLTIVDDVRAGDEALGILSFVAKAIVRLVPVAFGVGVIVGDVLLAWSSVALIKDGDFQMGNNSIKLLCLCACLPLASYIFFAFYHLTLDLLWAILAVPRKLDEMKENRKN
jgi:hypothetical protein